VRVKASVCVNKSVCGNALRLTELCGPKASVCKSLCVQKRLFVKSSVCEKLYEMYDANYVLVFVIYCLDTILLVCL
jgi:hypothetical protein